jgi:hypothetical protein
VGEGQGQKPMISQSKASADVGEGDVVLEEHVNHDYGLSRQRAEADRKKRHAADSPFPYPELSISLSAVTNTLLNREVALSFCVPKLRANLNISE